MVLLIVASLLPFVAFRHLPIFALAVLVLAGIYIDDAWSRLSPPRQTNRTIPRWMSIGSLVLGLALLLWSILNFQRIVIPNQPVSFFPDRAVSLIAESKVDGNLATEFNWGQYVIWHLGPAVQISMDGRRETVYSEEIYQMHLNFVSGTSEWDDMLNNNDTHFALVNRNGPARNLMLLKEGWELVYEDRTSSLFSSQDWHGNERLMEALGNSPELPVNDFFP